MNSIVGLQAPIDEPGNRRVALDAAGLEARVQVVETTGSETHLIADAGGTRLNCVLRERVSVRPGDQVRLGVDSACLHLFRADSGERLEPAH